jgi:DNA-binding SARP family transcriptional activator
MSQRPDHTVALSLIGGFDLTVDGRSVELADPARRLVAFLALRRKPQLRAFVAGSLWPDKPESRALANLRSALWTLHADDRPALVEAGGAALRLTPVVTVDVNAVQAEGWSLIDQSRGAVAGRSPDRLAESPLATDRDLLFEDLLPGWYDDWVLLERERLAELQVHTLDVLVEALIDADEHSRAIHLALRLVALDPLRERSQLALIRAYLAEGSFGRARRQHHAFCELMTSSFGGGYGRSFDDVLASAALSPAVCVTATGGFRQLR